MKISNEDLKHVSESFDNLISLKGAYSKEQAHLLHTLKGTVLTLGFEKIGGLLHHAEDVLPTDIESAYALIKEAQSEIENIMKKQISNPGICHKEDFFPLYLSIFGKLSLKEQREANQFIESLADSRSIQESIETRWIPLWKKTFETVLNHYPDKKAEVFFHTENLPNDRFLSEKMENDLFPLVEHLIRNSVAHGIENLAMRKAIKKYADAFVRVSINLDKKGLHVIVEDNGQGVTRHQNVEISEYAGRGIGLKAVQSGVTSLGGKVDIRSEIRKYTKISITVPVNTHKWLTGIVAVSENDEHYLIDKKAIKEVSYEEQQGGMASITLFNETKGAYFLDCTMTLPMVQQNQTDSIWVGVLNGQVIKFLSCDESLIPTTTPHDSQDAAKPEIEVSLVNTQEREPLIFIVDDSEISLRNLRRFLNSFRPEVSVKSHYDGIQAWEDIQNGIIPSIILSDWEMPVMKGDELLQKIKESGHDIPFVMISSKSIEKYRPKLIELGALDLLGKPFDVEKLQALLKTSGI